VPLPLYDLSTPPGRESFAQRLEQVRGTASTDSAASAAVADILADVRAHGDEAVVRYMRQWTDPDFTADRIQVPREQLAVSLRRLDGTLRDAIETSIAHVRAYQQHVMPSPRPPVVIDGCELGMRWSAVPSCGLNVPGGAAVLFSTLIMLAVPAQVAGVSTERISVVSPPPTRRGSEPAGDISPIVLATCEMLGIERVYRIGGAQAMAALAFGTESVQAVDLLAGPGNIYVQLAKAQLAGRVGTDNGFYGPSEIVTIADASANPAWVAADLLAQAEHDPGKCFVIAWSREVLDAILSQVELQRQQRGRVAAIDAALSRESCALLARDESHAAELADILAAEHVNLAVADPRAMLDKLQHGGEFFLGDATPVAAGDYYAGPSHCLPTGTTARFASGVSVYTFLKRSGTVRYAAGMDARTIAHIAALAEAEGLDAHAASARLRAGR
jgi:histidinol dehydrogenase